jgi:hypothetical protein
MNTVQVKVKLGQLDRTSVVLRQLVTEKLPFKASYWLRRDIDVIGRVYQPFLESKQGLFKEFAEMDKKGNIKVDETGTNVKLIDEKKEEFWKQYAELADKEVSIDVFPLKIEWFDKVEITVGDLSTVDFLLEVDEVAEKV